MGSGAKFLYLLFELAKAAIHLRKFLYANKGAFHLQIGHGRSSQHGFAVGHVAHDAGFCADGNLPAKLQVAGNAGLGSDDAIVGQTRAACETNLAHNQTMFADDNVVSDVDKVVDFRSLSDDG